MNRFFLAFAGFFGLTGIIFGSLSSHALTHVLTNDQLDIFRLGIQYQMYHTLALFAVAVWLNHQKNLFLTIAGWLFAFGILFFSGTMYCITYFDLPNIGTAPIGGCSFILGWLLLIIAACKYD
ncbi:DUF423 domain-containing protein [Orbus sturtevantii]|uniref:DUF423 domain-containing protein n=1 Tax=Orbus sturtevantii TaxID=3074109 RepID=UPI00370DBC36